MHRKPGGIGYVSPHVVPPPEIKVVSVLAAGTRGDPDTIVSEHGEVRLLLTGSCADGHGRRAILQNRSPRPGVRVVVETSRWSEGRFQSSHRDFHTLGREEEKGLGCTALGEAVEVRHAIVEVSDARRSDRRGEVHGPPRDYIAFVEAGTCGRDRRGRQIAVVNRHPWREIVVKVEWVTRVDGALRKRFTKSYRLAPGGTRKLGCNRDGGLVQEFHLLGAE